MATAHAIDWVLLDHAADRPVDIGDVVSIDAGGMPIYRVVALADGRAWQVGEAWAFDDTIEHEAWNDSDQPRVILIVDAWNPLLSEPERAVVRAAAPALVMAG